MIVRPSFRALHQNGRRHQSNRGRLSASQLMLVVAEMAAAPSPGRAHQYQVVPHAVGARLESLTVGSYRMRRHLCRLWRP